MSRLVMVLCVLLIASCREKTRSLAQFENILYHDLFNAYDLEIMDKGNLNTAREIKGAPMSWVTLFKASHYNSALKEIEYICLGYKIPFRRDKDTKYGILKIHRTFLKSCPNLYSDKDDQLKGISMLHFYLKKNVLSFELMMRLKGNKVRLQFPILNYKKERERDIYFLGYGEKSQFQNITLEKKKIGSFNLSNKCFDIDKKCNVIRQNNCNKCLFGSYEVPGGSCQQGGVRYCLPFTCGDKNMPACMRSKKIAGEDICYHGSRAGYCRPGLRTFCTPDNILICL